MKTFNQENPRFVWNIGAIPQLFPDLPEQGAQIELIDRATGKPVISIAVEWGNLFCLEHKQHGEPLSELECWLNKISEESLKSEGLPC